MNEDYLLIIPILVALLGARFLIAHAKKKEKKSSHND
jgi:hypothetical protein